MFVFSELIFKVCNVLVCFFVFAPLGSQYVFSKAKRIETRSAEIDKESLSLPRGSIGDFSSDSFVQN